MADANEDGATTIKTPRDRSPSFPFISLKPAIERMKEFEEKFGRQSPPADRTYLAWGYKGDTSQAQQTLAALKAFGLVEYNGSGPKRTVSMSDEARTYLRANQDSIKAAILKKIALKPNWFQRMWESWGSDRLPDEVCLDELVLKNKFNENAAPTFLRVYDETIAFAGLSDSDKVQSPDDGARREFIGDFRIGATVNWEINGSIQWKQPRKIISIDEHDGQYFYQVEDGTGQKGWIPVEQAIEHITSRAEGGAMFAPPPDDGILTGRREKSDEPVPEGTREDKASLDEGEVVLRWPEQLSKESVEDFEYWVKGLINRAKRRAGMTDQRD